MQKKNKKTGLVVSDTSCFIILQKIDALNILPQLYSEVVTTPEIAAEYKFELPSWVIIRKPKDLFIQEQFIEEKKWSHQDLFLNL